MPRRSFLAALIGGLAWLAGKGKPTKPPRPPKPTPSPTPSPTPTPTPTPSPSPSPTPTPTPTGPGVARFTDLYGTNPTTHMLVIDRPVLLDADVTVFGLDIQPGGAVLFPPDTSRTLTSDGHGVLVSGLLEQQPSSASVQHLLRFVNIDETAFVGGSGGDHHSDPGLVVMDGGQWRAAGAAKLPWTRAAGSLPAGAEVIRLEQAPQGWRVGDEITITPTGAVSDSSHYLRYDTRTVLNVGLDSITVAPLTYAHPSWTDPRTGVTQGAEVLNLTRNVRVEGTPGHRAHVMTHTRLNVSHVQIRHMGPRQASGEADYTQGVLGRYGLHFHKVGEAARGSTVTDVVVRDCGFRAFVPHDSNGVTFTGCISHDTFDEAYWWDPIEPDGTQTSSRDTTWASCVASKVQCDPGFRGYRLAGFVLGSGDGSRLTDSVAVGVQGNQDAAGYIWPEGGQSTWEFHGNTAHNNRNHGIFTWQNDVNSHEVTDFTCWRNSGSGISHGAYDNVYHYTRFTLADNAGPPLLLHAVSHPAVVEATGVDRRLTFADSLLATTGPVAVELVNHNIDPAGKATVIRNTTLTGGIRQTYPDAKVGADVIDLVDSPPTFVDLTLSEPGSVVREITAGRVTQTWTR